MGQHMLFRVWFGMEGFGDTAGFAFVERGRVAFGGVGGQRGNDMEQFPNARAGLGRGE